MIGLKRVYEPSSPDDGTRVLVDRLWPRGVSKSKAAVDVWLKEVAPSPDLRKWFSHEDAKWDEFRERYWKELEANPANVQKLKDMADKGKITLIFSTRDEVRNSAAILRDFLTRSDESG
ncbi:MAG TPA: DUF488 domain-containing protein [Methanomassiliicoccales archaeon]|jgi:uncharacterized protein YeaO (DUF488 family)